MSDWFKRVMCPIGLRRQILMDIRDSSLDDDIWIFFFFACSKMFLNDQKIHILCLGSKS